MARTKTPSWYSKKIPLEGLAYLLAEREVVASLVQFQDEEANAVALGVAALVSTRSGQASLRCQAVVVKDRRKLQTGNLLAVNSSSQPDLRK